MRRHIFHNRVNLQPVTFIILFFRDIQTLQMRLSREACFWWTQLLRPFCRAADVLCSYLLLFISSSICNQAFMYHFIISGKPCKLSKLSLVFPSSHLSPSPQIVRRTWWSCRQESTSPWQPSRISSRRAPTLRTSVSTLTPCLTTAWHSLCPTRKPSRLVTQQTWYSLSTESQKGVNAVQWCSVENQQCAIIQILTATVMKYHVSVDCQESYIFPRGYNHKGKYNYLGTTDTAKRVIFSQGVIITRENITILAPPTRDISSVPVNICYIRWSKWMISSKFDGALWLSQSLVTRLGVCVQTMWTQTWQLCALSIMTFFC